MTPAQTPAFRVSPTDATDFAKVWKYKGLSVPLTEVHAQFATDFANIAIRSFIEFTMAQAKARAEAETTKNAPLIVEK